MDRKMLIIVGDALSFEWLLKFQLIEEFIPSGSTVGLLESVIPPTTPPAFATMVTGVEPRLHGIWGFDSPDDHLINIQLHSLYPTLWELFDSINARTAWLWHPVAFPAPRLKHGMFISGFHFPIHKHEKPSKILQKAISVSSIDELKILKNKDIARTIFEFDQHGLKGLIEGIESRREIVEELLNLNYNLIFTVFLETDRVIHRYSNPNAIKIIYKKFVDNLQSLIKSAKRHNYHIMVLSDHGGAEMANRVVFVRTLISHCVKAGTDAALPAPPVNFVKTPLNILRIGNGPVKSHSLTSLPLYVPVAISRYATILTTSRIIKDALIKCFHKKFRSVIEKVKDLGYVNVAKVGKMYAITINAKENHELITKISFPLIPVYKSFTTKRYMHSKIGVFLYIPACNKGSKTIRLISNVKLIDIAPTVLYLYNIQKLKYMQGNIVIEPFIASNKPNTRDSLRVHIVAKLRRYRRLHKIAER